MCGHLVLTAQAKTNLTRQLLVLVNKAFAKPAPHVLPPATCFVVYEKFTAPTTKTTGKEQDGNAPCPPTRASSSLCSVVELGQIIRSFLFC
jgi:hypothetical protein